MKRLLTLGLGIFTFLQLSQAQTETTVVSPESYAEMKEAGELDDNIQYVIDEGQIDEEIHPEVYESNPTASGRDATCDCWVEPDDTYTTLNLSDDGSSSLIPIPFTFCLYGNNYTSLYINANGNVTFGSSLGTFTPDGFPISTPMVAPFWADVNLTVGGEIRYKVTDDAIYINWIEANYYGSNNPNQTNTFQVILTDGENEFVGLDRNVSFCYQDMQWTTGTASSGSGGFGGSAATVGANQGTGGNAFIQFGRFNQDNDDYDGPFGADDGVDFLDDQSFTFSACSDFSDNVAPVPTGLGSCDTLYVCQGESVDLFTQFLAPEDDQEVTITFDDGGVSGFSDIEITDGDIGEFSGMFTGSTDNVGIVDVTITATDDGSPAASTTVIVTIVVTETEIPLFEIDGEPTFCGGGNDTLVATPGFDQYVWNVDGCTGDTCIVDQSGTYSVTGFLSGCDANASIDVEEGDFFLPPVQVENQPICSNDSTLVTSVNEYESYEWEVFEDFPGIVYSDNTNQQSVYLSSGSFVLMVETENGCIGQRIFNISATDAVIPEDDISGLYCDGPEEIEFFGAYSDANSGSLNMFLINTSGDGWQGGSVDVFIDDELVGNYTLESGMNQTSFSIPITYGEYIDIIYNSGSNDGGNIFNFTNCGGGPVFDQPGIQPANQPSDTLFSGYTGCSADPAFGSWSVTGPDYEISNVDADENDYDIIFNPLEYGEFELCFTDSACEIETCYDLEFSEEPGVELDSEVLVCDETEYVLEPSVTDPADDTSGGWESGEGTGPLTVDESGTYCYTIANSCGEASACIDVTFSATPEPALSDTLLCGGSGQVVLDPIENESSDFDYLWQGGSADGSTSPQVTATESGIYTVTVSSPCGSVEAQAEVTIVPGASATIETETTTICDGGPAELEVVGQLEGEIEWSTGETGSTIIVEESGSYCVTVTTECESAEDCIEISIAEEPFVEIQNNDFVLCPGDPQTIYAEATGTFGGVYQWNASYSSESLSETGDTYTVYSEDIPQSDLNGPVLYSVTVSGPCGTATDEVIVTPALCQVTIPNIISPNGDNHNDGFIIEGIEHISSAQLKVFDRWGKLIYSDDSYSNNDPWEAEEQVEGTYYYTLVLPTEEFSGYITVVR